MHDDSKDKVYTSEEAFIRFLLIDYYKAQSDKETIPQHFCRTVIMPDLFSIGQQILYLDCWDDHKDLWFEALMTAIDYAYPDTEKGTP